MSKLPSPKINIRNLNPDIYSFLKKEAEKNCRSLEGEVRFALGLYAEFLIKNKNQEDRYSKILSDLSDIKSAMGISEIIKEKI
ncbi:hypothetical protein OX111_004537 [Escherichia coli]|uniref:FitA-like ribbon-helix-helix domain-containing protein n=1 Tax=Escherichia coli TaxID=562 RepID=UPI00181FCCD6|nr:hypothetical protein [Escherichia coli]ELL3397586.1 hypothetical protein [Shigella sonnei]EEW5306221.1 hypothetical protein [Escherichia coli]EEX1162471.1 hypothetical protein [Escherichia coli]EFB5176778.1 hypothetical protein [Escherichia coli]EHC4347592.1 hypothetical protein [Escherichia coli]